MAGAAELSCNEIAYHETSGAIAPQFANKLKTAFVVNVTGAAWAEAGESMDGFPEFSTLTCGSGSYLKMALNTSVNLDGTTSGTTGSNASITTTYPMSFVYDPDNTNETFAMTSQFVNSKPSYKKLGEAKYIYFNGTEYVVSNSLGSGKLLGNGACIPNAKYSDNLGEKYTDSHFVEISGFTGQHSNLNGNYYHVGYYNGQKTYRDSNCADHYYFYAEPKLGSTDTPFNGQGCYIIGDSDQFSCLDASNGHNCFDGQRACVFDGNVDPRSLMTEDALKSLSTEDSLKVLITEAEL